MSLIDIIKPLSTVLSSVVNKSQQHQEKIYWESRELNPGLLGEKQYATSLLFQSPREITLVSFDQPPGESCSSSASSVKPLKSEPMDCDDLNELEGSFIQIPVCHWQQGSVQSLTAGNFPEPNNFTC